MALDKTAAAKNVKVDLCYLASIWSSDASEDRLIMMLDWNNCVRIIENHLENVLTYIVRYFSLMIVCHPRSASFPYRDVLT